MSVARLLTELRADHVLILAALDGKIIAAECAMPECRCPEGRAHFEHKGNPRHNPWAPSADRWPVPGRHGGAYEIENVRLAHALCNTVEGGKATKGRVPTAESRAKMARAKIGNTNGFRDGHPQMADRRASGNRLQWLNADPAFREARAVGLRRRYQEEKVQGLSRVARLRPKGAR